MRRVYQIAIGSLVVIFAAMPFVAMARQSDEGPFLLVTGVDINGEGYPLARVNLADNSESTLVTFANQPECPPSVFGGGTGLIYEIAEANPSENIYRVDTQTGVRESLNVAENLNCPVVSPTGDRIAWVRQTEGADSQTLVITDGQGNITHELITHPNIYDVQWSPGGSALIYNVTSNDSPFPALYSLPIEAEAEPRSFWSRYLGLAEEYEWVPDGSGLLVTYYTEENAALALLSTDCVIGLGPACEAEPLATFPGEDTLNLLGAYSLIEQQVVIGVQSQDAIGNVATDLWVIDLLGTNPPRQLTQTPDIVETDAYWSFRSREIYFIGSRFDADAGVLRGGIYSIPADGSTPPTLRFASSVFSPGAILWVDE